MSAPRSDLVETLARGHHPLEAPLPAAGRDEIGSMAEALAVFRDTALELRNSDLREIAAARRRLTDAIEAISEAFALYDAEDRLVICNSRFREDLFPALADVLECGLHFGDFVRAAAARRLFAEAEADSEAWIVERLAKHDEAAEPHLQQLTDGRWIQVDERRTEDGGTVALYTDVTAIKNREAALAAKTADLERLSATLAKFLSPQVYATIFRNPSEVHIASRRKKLTIFFSDIAGFTEVTDRLEPEEVTEFVNRYLTEMSKIAVAFGGTVDKYMGDGILIFFGDPESRGVTGDALAAVEMAIAMQKRIAAMADGWRQVGILNPPKVRMGIHTGFSTVGNFGSEDRMDYTIIGGGVNTASRLEKAATPGEVLISYETFAHVRDRVFCRERGSIEVKGLAYPLDTYSALDTFEALDAARRHLHEEHPCFSLDLSPGAMTPEERHEAATALHRALALLEEEQGSPVG